MAYDSQISFTLDTICPWTYLGLVRLRKALAQYKSNTSGPQNVNFTIKYLPYQLYPSFSKTGEDKYQWYKREKYNDSEEKMEMYTKYMGALGEAEGIEFKFGGTIANTLEAHRLIYWVQEKKGEDGAAKVVDSLYTQYFQNEANPSSPETLLKAATAAGVDEAEAKAFIEDEYEALQDVKDLIREQASNDIDSVPTVIVEGKRRDFTLTGAKEVAEYSKVLESVAKESQ